VSANGALLWCRAALLASVALLAAALAHLGADGRLPGPLVLVVLLVTGTALCAPLLRREASRARVCALLVLGQAGVHVVLTALSGHAGHPGMPAADHAEHHAAGPGSALEHLTSDLSGPHAVMAVAHALAAVVVGLWLASGERALWALVRRAGRALRRPLLLAAPVRTPTPVPVEAHVDSPAVRLLASGQRRRGPPSYALPGHP